MKTIEFKSVCKSYGKHHVLDNVSFTCAENETIALLGRNGAGKSTLMNMLTGYIAPTSGSISVCGFDTQNYAVEARKCIGYLPEVPPLYPDMTVTEFLKYCARLKGISAKSAGAAAEKVILFTNLQEYSSRLISQLSKGYKQRLGLAQTIINSPKVLVLDEPSNGLDPLQLIHMRDMLRELSCNCTVLLSSHVLSEVTSICSRAVIVDKNKIVVDTSMDQLLHQNTCISLICKSHDGIADLLKSIDGVLCAEPSISPASGEEKYRITSESDKDIRRNIITSLEKNGIEILEISKASLSLEEAFLCAVSQSKEEL